MFANVGAVNTSHPDKKLLFTEGCVEGFDPSRFHHWPHAERYGRALINDFNHGTVGWTDWNILLDHRGGPNHVGNFCFAPVHANPETGELIFTPSYFYLGHFSKFIRPGARRISTASSRSHLLSTSFQNTDGGVVTVVMNPTDVEIRYRLQMDGRAMAVVIPAHAIQTVVTKSASEF